MQIPNVLLLSKDWQVHLLFCRGSLVVLKCIILSLSKHAEAECEEERPSAIEGVRKVVETAYNKMSAAPELNPGD